MVRWVRAPESTRRAVRHTYGQAYVVRPQLFQARIQRQRPHSRHSPVLVNHFNKLEKVETARSVFVKNVEHLLYL